VCEQGGEGGHEAEVGVAIAGEAAQGHRAGLPRGLRALHHVRAAARRVRPLQPRPEGQDAPHRLPPTG